MNIPSTIRAMRDAGVDERQIVDTVLALAEQEEAEREKKTAERRAKDAERQRRHRHAESRDVTRTTKDATDTPETRVSPTPPSQTQPLSPRSPKGELPPTNGKSRGHALPRDWEPGSKFWDWAKRKSHTETECNAALEEMREWAFANSNRQVGRKADWEEALKSWVRRNTQKAQPRASPHSRQSMWEHAKAETRKDFEH